MTWLPYLTMTLLAFVGMLLIFIILLQRGRGGGIAGALGGAGGQSAFGTKAGDVFTKITVVLAIIWVLLAAINVYALRATGPLYPGGDDAVLTAPALKPGEDAASGATDAATATEIPADNATTAPAATTPATETPAATTPEASKPAEGTSATPAAAGEASSPAQPAADQPAAPASPAQPTTEKPATEPAAPANP